MTKDNSLDFFMKGLKVNVNPKDNPIDSNFFCDLVNELTIINNMIVSGNMFSAGFNLGRLQGDLVFLMNQIEEEEKKELKKGNSHV